MQTLTRRPDPEGRVSGVKGYKRALGDFDEKHDHIED
jgi:hypothetical protein